MATQKTTIIVFITALLFVVSIVLAGFLLWKGGVGVGDGELQSKVGVGDGELQKKEYEFTLKVVGSGSPQEMTMYDGLKTFFLEQGLALVDKSGNPVDVTTLGKSLKVKYPGSTDFNNVNIGVSPGNAILYYLAIWPPLIPGEYIFEVEYKDGTVEEKTVNWDQPREVIAQATGESDVSKGVAYQLGDLNLSTFEEMYHIRPSGSAIKVESSGDKYFWLKDSVASPGEHVVLVKQEGIWYVAKINVGS